MQTKDLNGKCGIHFMLLEEAINASRNTHHTRVRVFQTLEPIGNIQTPDGLIFASCEGCLLLLSNDAHIILCTG